MRIIIEIHEKDYQAIKNGHIPFSVLDAIMNGTPLPKGCGDLIDRDELEVDTEWNDYSDWFISYSYGQIADAPVIIPADKEREE